MRWVEIVLCLELCACMGWAQSAPNASPANQQPANSQPQKSSQPDLPPDQSKSTGGENPKLAPPRSDRVNADSLEDGESSSKDTQIDLSPPAGDTKAHPNSTGTLEDEGSGDVKEFHPWDPHKAAKDVEVGDFYFKRKNYKAAEDRYREALLYKDKDAVATYRLAVCLEKMGRPQEAMTEFENYLQILPRGPEAEDSRKAIARLEASSGSAKAGK
jgi:tetratricopeptide (TPR) repeat protein